LVEKRHCLLFHSRDHFCLVYYFLFAQAAKDTSIVFVVHVERFYFWFYYGRWVVRGTRCATVFAKAFLLYYYYSAAHDLCLSLIASLEITPSLETDILRVLVVSEFRV